MKNSKYSGFYKLTVDERLNEVKEFANLSEEQTESLKDPSTLDINRADNMIENVIGRYTLPMGVALNFLINGKDYLIPMVTEEPSVIAAASNGAKVARSSGGFKAFYVKSNMIAQVQVTDVLDCNYAKMQILENKDEIIKKCNECDPTLVGLGGGAFDIDVRILRTLKNEELLIVHLKVNTLDAMGANTVNTMAESVAPYIEELTGGKVYLRILTNLAADRLVRASVKIKKEELGGEDVVDKIVSATDFAFADPYRAATHNKGIMNGISAAVMATGNDTRAIESGAHAYASITGQYLPLTTWEKNKDGDLVGTIEIPMAVGLVGGATKIHPQAQTAVSILGVKSADELGEIIAALGLGQNLSAVRALATEGIQRGHMSLHAKNVAIEAGAKGNQIEEIVNQMINDKKINVEYAKKLLEK
ncbi:hydroxymethylglutaryl-CoA reductase, degradative [uncultured Anaerococcus sp.]|uniref:hydroxymethylglutaryl-CoA reductase, degradative n=1 Tax=uncultured Anaerococcus sp. TaxID=293428 RepID=UPI0025D0E6B1|nr:hydroxymethylglutaryl-CoA reductase, degradative [uncultured Anaerococcus sp.]